MPTAMSPGTARPAAPIQHGQSSRSVPRIKTWHLLLLSGTIHAILLLYAQHVDTHPELYGGLKYTDVDWRVVMDGARLISPSTSAGGPLARGWFAGNLAKKGWRIGDPYGRATFRYTPLLPLTLLPGVYHDLLGKVILSIISLTVPLVLLSRRSRTISKSSSRSVSGIGPATEDCHPLFWPVHLLWTLNPFVLNITTRGSPEAIIVLLVVSTFACLRLPTLGIASAIYEGKERKTGDSSRLKRSAWKGEVAGAILFALSVAFKIYPIIYTPSIWVALSHKHGLFGWGVWRFGSITLLSLVLVNGALWSIWGQPFIEHTYLYHLTRSDHRHNFSPYYYPIYLSLSQFSRSTSGSESIVPSISTSLISANSPLHQPMSSLLSFILSPLSSFLPQAILVLSLGFILPSTSLDLESTAFFQTATFVVFNKVCTSQYFLWFIPFIPALIGMTTNSQSHVAASEGRGDSGTEKETDTEQSIAQSRLVLSGRKALILVAAWVVAQAAWLGSAYRLELLARDAHLSVWAAGIGLFGISVWVLGSILDSIEFL